MESYREYLREKAEIEENLKLKRLKILNSIISEIKECVEIFDIKPHDVFPDIFVGKKKRRAKYIDPVSRKTWSGVGKEPLWMRGRDRSEFLLEVPID